MLVKLYELKDDWRFMHEQAEKGVVIRKPIAPENPGLIEWVETHFNRLWAGEARAAVCNRPVSCFIAQREKAIIGFACHDAAALGFFGPSGVLESHRRQGIGRALLLACLLDMKLKGYGYAVIGGVGPRAFYERAVCAVEIPGSTPGIYEHLRGPDH